MLATEAAALVQIPPRTDRLPRPVTDDSSIVEIAYCMRYEYDLPDRTVRRGAKGEPDKVTVCHICIRALQGETACEACVVHVRIMFASLGKYVELTLHSNLRRRTYTQSLSRPHRWWRRSYGEPPGR